MIRSFLSLALGTGLIAAAPAAAQEIPIEISWQGDPPSSISRSGDDGLRNLTPAPGEHVFRGHFKINGNGVQRRMLIISYGTFNFPIDVRVYRQLPGVTFTISHQAPRSCTEDEVITVTGTSNNLADAINRSVGAGRLLVIPSPNDCDRDLRLAAARARYRQSVRMAYLSQGLFQVNEQIEADYREIAQANGVSVAGEVMAYARDDLQLEAVQLAAARVDAQGDRDFARAVDLTELMTERVRSDPLIREAYRERGAIERNLVREQAYLSARVTAAGPN